MVYGFSFQGSKSKIAKDIIDILPKANNFYDLFAGGCAITHCAMLSNKWKNFIANDIQNTTELFLHAINGKFKHEKRWISREDFHKLKTTNNYVRWIWSFGNNGVDYLFGKNIEHIKKEAHEYLFSHGYDYTPSSRIRLINKFKKKTKLEGRFELQQLEQLERLKTHAKDYREIEIKPNSIVYCDIPYRQKKESKEKYYGLSFNYVEFYTWAKTRRFPVYFSSCFCEDDFECVFEKEKLCLMNNKNLHDKKIVEKLYWNGIGENIMQENYLF